MKNRQYFYREDLSTYKPKFILLCRQKEFKIEKHSNTIAQLENKHYLSQIKIVEL